MNVHVNPKRIHTLNSSCLVANIKENTINYGLSGGAYRKKKRSKSRRKKVKRSKINSMNGSKKRKQIRRFRS